MPSDVCELLPPASATAPVTSPTEVAPATAKRDVALTRVLHIINGEHYAGAERVQDLLALDLPNHGFDVAFATLKTGLFATTRRSQAVPIHALQMRHRFDLRPAKELARTIRRDNFSLIHTHTPRAALIGRIASAITGVPLVHHIHSPTNRDSTRWIQNKINAYVEQLSVRNISASISVSNSLACYARDLNIPAERSYVVYNGVPPQGELPSRDTPTQCWTLGTVALFRPRKGLEILLHAMAQLRQAGHDVRLRAIGGFESEAYRKKIEALVQSLQLESHIDWTGFTTNVSDEFSKLDLFILPSLFGEGLPMVVLEAMAAGIPMVGTRVEGVTESIRHQIDGLLVAPNDAQALAQAISQYLLGQVDWQAFRSHAHRRQADHFSVQSMSRGIANVYREVLGE